jgi:hypothetical protein
MANALIENLDTEGKYGREKRAGKTEEKEQKKKEGDEPDPRHWWKTAVAASFPT